MVTELCNAKLYLADDEGDNHCTITCELASGHKGYHLESFSRQDPAGRNDVTITWTLDEGTVGKVEIELEGVAA